MEQVEDDAESLAVLVLTMTGEDSVFDSRLNYSERMNDAISEMEVVEEGLEI
jgi:hypothetical protein